MMNEEKIPEDLVVDFSKDFTIECKYGNNSVKFAFELGPSNKPNLIYLYVNPVFNPKIDDNMKNILSKQAVKYLESCGYEVETISN